LDICFRLQVTSQDSIGRIQPVPVAAEPVPVVVPAVAISELSDSLTFPAEDDSSDDPEDEVSDTRLVLQALESLVLGSSDAAIEHETVAFPTSRRHQFTRSLANPRDGRRAYCDFCDCDSQNPASCLAVLMLKQVQVEVVIEDWQYVHQREPEKDPDNSQARYALYRAVVGWLWANPLGAENRVRLPPCLVKQIRQLFPNPVCSGNCDYFTACERLGHYVGFRTADESRRLRDT